MPLALINTDPVSLTVDVMAVAVDASMQHGGNVCKAIIAKHGMQLREALKEKGLYNIGQARCVQSRKLVHDFSKEPSRKRKFQKLIVTVAPTWKKGGVRETALLKQCYTNIIDTALHSECRSIGIEFIDEESYGVPEDIALDIAEQAISEHPAIDEIDVFLVSFKQSVNIQAWEKERQISHNLFSPKVCFAIGVNSGIVPTENGITGIIGSVIGAVNSPESLPQNNPHSSISLNEEEKNEVQVRDALKTEIASCDASTKSRISICIGGTEIEIGSVETETFSQMLLRRIDESGMKDSEVYKKAQVSKQLFSKIRSDLHYQPKKGTVIAFALALNMNLDETKELLYTAGFTLTESRIPDKIIIICIMHHVRNMFKVNEYLYECGQPLLSSI